VKKLKIVHFRFLLDLGCSRSGNNESELMKNKKV